MRQEDDHAADAGDRAVGDKAREGAVPEECVNRRAECDRALVDAVHQRRGPGENRLKDDGHDHEQPDGARQRPVHEAGEARAHGRDRRRRVLNVRHHFADPAIAPARLARERRLLTKQARTHALKPLPAAVAQQARNFAGEIAVAVDERALDLESGDSCRQIPGEFLGRGAERVPEGGQFGRRHVGEPRELGLQGVDALPCRCHDRADAHAAEAFAEGPGVNAYAAGFRRIRHGQRDHERQAELHQLLDEKQALVQMRAVDNGQDPGRPRRVGHAPQNDVGGNSLLQRMRRQREHARQVNELEAAAGRGGDADMLLYRHTGIIPGLLAHAGQPVEKGAFPAVGVTDDRDTYRRLSACGDLVGRYMGKARLIHLRLRGTRRTVPPARGAARLHCRTCGTPSGRRQ